MTQHSLRCKDDQRLADASPVRSSMHLAPQHMEILSWSGGVHHLHIVFGAELQKALNTGAGMLRALPFVAVRQQQNQAARLAPFGFGAGNEIIDENLSAVRKIAELRFPENQSKRIGQAVTEFETHHGVFAERRIEHIEPRLICRKVPQRNKSIAGLAVVKFQMALAECSAPAILPAEPYRRSFQHQASKCEGFGSSPIHGCAIQNFAALS